MTHMYLNTPSPSMSFMVYHFFLKLVLGVSYIRIKTSWYVKNYLNKLLIPGPILFVRQFPKALPSSCLTLRSFLTHLYFDFQTPLSRAFLKALKTGVLTDLNGRPLRHTRNMTQFQPLSRGANQISSIEATVSRMEQDYHISPYMNTRSSFVSDSPSSLFRPGMTAAAPVESRTSFFARKIRYFVNFLIFAFSF